MHAPNRYLYNPNLGIPTGHLGSTQLPGAHPANPFLIQTVMSHPQFTIGNARKHERSQFAELQVRRRFAAGLILKIADLQRCITSKLCLKRKQTNPITSRLRNRFSCCDSPKESVPRDAALNRVPELHSQSGIYLSLQQGQTDLTTKPP